MDYQLLALDMDGTALDSEKRIPREIVEGMRDLMAKGIHVVVSTGRGLAELADYEEEFRGMHYGILISGGMVYDFHKQEPVYAEPIPLEDALAVIEAGEAEKAMVHLLTIRNSVVREWDIRHMEDYCMEVYRDMYERVCSLRDDLAEYTRRHAEEVVKINLYHRSEESAERNFARLRERNLSLVHAEVTGLEASPAGVTKAKGLEILCGHLGVPLEKTVAVGDAPNDLEVLQTAGLSVAMGNAREEVKAVCDVTVADNDHLGVLEVMRRYFE